MAGRPTDYSEDIVNRIIDRIRSTSDGLEKICEEEGMPSRSTIYRWLDDNKEFQDKYARAKEDQADVLVEQILIIADDGTNDTIQTEFGPKENTEWVNRSKVRIDARKWAASKLKPKKYGDKLDLTSDGAAIPQVMPNVIVYNSAPPLASSEEEVS